MGTPGGRSHQRRDKKPGRALAVFAFIILVLGMTLAASGVHASGTSSPSGATIASDQDDYAPGSTVTLTGSGWRAGESIHIQVTASDGSWNLDSNPNPQADAGGLVHYGFQIPSWYVPRYSVTATGPQSGIATTTFTDASVGTYDQCSNDTGTGYTSGDTGCRWINGNLQSNNSYYAEGDATVQRLYLTGLTAGSHSVTFQYGTTKGGKHAYDFLTSWNWSEKWITQADLCQNITGCTGWTQSTLDIPQDPNVPDSFEPSAPGDRMFTMANGTLVSATTPTIFSGSYSGDSETQITINFTVPTGVSEVVLWFGAHVSAQANWGLGMGAASISGSPYHVSLAAFDGASIGSRDNQMQASAVTVIPNGTIVIVKDAVPNDAQDFSFKLTNNSTITQNFSLDDDSDATLPNSQTFSVPPGSWTAQELSIPSGWDLTKLVCTDPTSNSSTDLASATATINLASNETVTCTFTDTKPGKIIVNKTATGGDATFAYTTTGGDGLPGSFNITTSSGSGSVTYNNIVPGTYSISESALAGWKLTGSSCDSGTPASFTVPAGGTVTCSFTNVRSYNQDLTVTKTATASFDRTYQWSIDKSVDQTTMNIADGGKATFNYSVKVSPNGSADSNWALSGTITVTNPNAFAVSGVSVTDAFDGGGSCSVTGGTNVTVPANDKVELAYSCSFSSQPSYSGTNTATASWDKTTYTTPTGTASGTKDVTFALATETNKVVTVVDDKTDPSNPVTLGTWNWADGEHTFTYSKDFTGVAGACTDYTNTAKITETEQTDSQKVTVCVGKDLTVAKTAAGSFDRTYQWSIDKSVDQTTMNIAEGGKATFNYTVKVTQTGVTDSNWALSGKITVTNPNDWEDIVVDVTDAYDGGGTCTVANGTTVTVPKSGQVTLDYSCSFSSQPSYSGTNTATVSWDKTAAFTPNASAQGSATASFTQSGSTNKTVTVTDTLGGNLGSVTATDEAPFASKDFSYSHDFTGVAGACTDYDNTAKIVETGQTDSQKVTVCVSQDLTVAKTAAGSFDRAYKWSIDKSVDQTTVNIIGIGSATFNYSVKVSPNGSAASNWALSGKITVTNPNDFDIAGVTVTDAFDGGGTCAVTGGTNVTVPKNGQVTLDYSCSFSSQPSTSGTNTATATWDKSTYTTPTDTASGTKDVTFTLGKETNKVITVVDDKTDPSSPVTLGQRNWADGEYTFTYTLTKQATLGKCMDYTNTAKITETGQTDSQKVTVCSQSLGDFTMGWWQNKNGQAMIKAAGPSTGTCSLTGYLRTFKPFQDLSATANCNQVASYVSGVIGKAKASDMISMLKAQMLSTSLGVYFTDPAHNAFGSPISVGSLTIDLTHVCTSATSCDLNVSSAFGGASSMKVSDMLTYAASQYVDATHWYGTDKATQTLAQRAFAAINNGWVVTAP